MVKVDLTGQIQGHGQIQGQGQIQGHGQGLGKGLGYIQGGFQAGTRVTNDTHGDSQTHTEIARQTALKCPHSAMASRS